jgi:hypothetical protein
MNNPSGPGRRREDPQRQDRQDDERERRSAGGDQGGQSGKKNAGRVLPEGEKVGEWSEKESDEE